MRITGGMARGIPLKCPIKNVRPATDRIRQALFSSLGNAVAQSSVLDLFAGSGSYGLEAISRGASDCHFVEKNRLALASLKENLATVKKALGGGEPLCRISSRDVFSWRPKEPRGFDFIFIDPPYSQAVESSDSLFTLAESCLSENPDSRLLFEMPGDYCPNPGGWELVRRLGSQKAGEPAVNIFKLCSPG